MDHYLDDHFEYRSLSQFTNLFGSPPSISCQTFANRSIEYDTPSPTNNQLFRFRRTIWFAQLSQILSNNYSEQPEPLTHHGIIPKQLKQTRQTYLALCKKHQKKPTTQNVHPLHPLSRTSTSVQSDDELLSEIRKDVDRTYSERAFFNQAEVRDCLERMLFVYAKENLDIAYKQGMNELVAVVLYATHQEQWASKEKFADAELEELCSGDNVEADTYTIFRFLMDLGVKTMFQSGKGKNSSPVLNRCNYVYHVLLRKADPQLYVHLSSMEVEPQLFLLRWLRLLFCREFHLEDTILIWDAIIADAYLNRQKITSQRDLLSSDGKYDTTRASYLLGLTDFFAIAMMKYVRPNLMESDTSGCLKRLLKFPPLESVRSLIPVALKERDSINNTEEDETTRRKTANYCEENKNILSSVIRNDCVNSAIIMNTNNKQTISESIQSIRLDLVEALDGPLENLPVVVQNATQKLNLIRERIPKGLS